MRFFLHSMIVAIMLWLPVSQAAALCCAEPVQMSEMHAAQAGPHSMAAHEASDSDSAGPVTDCPSACVQLGHLPLPATPCTPAVAPTHRDPAAHGVAFVLPPHRDPLLRPPRPRS